MEGREIGRVPRFIVFVIRPAGPPVDLAELLETLRGEAAPTVRFRREDA